MSVNRLPLALLSSLALLAAVPAQGAAARAKDTIVTREGQRVRGVEVTAATATKITFQKGAQEDSIGTDKVVEIQWDTPPESFAKAQAHALKGEFAPAAELFAEAAKQTERVPLQQEAQFLAARSLLQASARDAAKAAEASAALDRYLKEHEDSFRAPEAMLLRGRALRLAGQQAESETALKAFEEQATRNALGAYWQARARYELAETLSALGRPLEARSAYQAAVAMIDAAAGRGRADDELVALKLQCVVGQGETFVREKKYEDALRYFREIATSATGEQANLVRAAALAGEGEALFLSADPAKAPERLREAQVALARASVLDPTSGTTTAKALYYQGMLLLALGGEREQNGRARASALFDTVTRYYADTPFAPLARAELEKK